MLTSAKASKIKTFLSTKNLVPDILEYFDPGEENHDGNHVVVLHLPETEKLKIRVNVGVVEKFRQQTVYLDRPIHTERHRHHGKLTFLFI